MYHLDAATYGSPTRGLNQTQADQFRRLTGDVGRGQYKSYNPTGPIPTSVAFSWTGETLATFRREWRDATKLNYGADWFTMDLPLMLDHAGEADTMLYPYSPTPDTDFALVCTLGDGPAAQIGYNSPIWTTSPFGELVPNVLFGMRVGRFHFSAAGTFFLTFEGIASGDTSQLPNNLDYVTVQFPTTGETADLNWSQSNARYVRANAAPNAFALWQTSQGTDQLVILTMRTQPYQRYRVHATGSFAPTLIGHDHWSVNIPIEVDMSPTLVLP